MLFFIIIKIVLYFIFLEFHETNIFSLTFSNLDLVWQCRIGLSHSSSLHKFKSFKKFIFCIIKWKDKYFYD